VRIIRYEKGCSGTNVSVGVSGHEHKGIFSAKATVYYCSSGAGPSTTCTRTRMRSETYQESIYPLFLSCMHSGTAGVRIARPLASESALPLPRTLCLILALRIRCPSSLHSFCLKPPHRQRPAVRPPLLADATKACPSIPVNLRHTHRARAARHLARDHTSPDSLYCV
jgi:hypothetical protein